MTTITGSGFGVVFGSNPGWGKSNHDHLPLPNGKTVGETDDSSLFRMFDRLGVPGFKHALGRLDRRNRARPSRRRETWHREPSLTLQ
jgi:hypothetical protein